MNGNPIATVRSDTGEARIDVVKNASGYIELHEYVKRYDEEEDAEYEIRVIPNPAGLFDDPEAAVEEARRILQRRP